MSTSPGDDFQTNPGHDPAEDHIGPLYYRATQGQYEGALVATTQHCNVVGIVHGGVLMTLADFTACLQATDNYADEDCVTVSFSAEFVSAAPLGATVICRTQISRKTGSLVFLTGRIEADGALVLTFSTVIKRLRRD